MLKLDIFYLLFVFIVCQDDDKRKKKKRPPPKLFDPEMIRSIGGEIGVDGDFLMFEGNRYSHKGFLYRNFVLNAIITEGNKQIYRRV